MSKSYKNTIDIFIEREELKRRVMGIVTDTRGVGEIKDPDHCNLFAIYQLFGAPEQTAEMRDRYLKPGLKYADAKKELVELIWNYFAPHREKRAELVRRPDTIRDIMRTGAGQARAVAEVTMEDAPRKVGLMY
jgi:tryptophanyl-tRNA synthetase